MILQGKKFESNTYLYYTSLLENNWKYGPIQGRILSYLIFAHACQVSNQAGCKMALQKLATFMFQLILGS